MLGNLYRGKPMAKEPEYAILKGASGRLAVKPSAVTMVSEREDKACVIYISMDADGFVCKDTFEEVMRRLNGNPL